MPQITINNQVITFPNTGTAADWSPAVIQFAQAVETAFNLVINSNDIPPQSFSFSNNATNQDVTNLLLISGTKGAVIDYQIQRTVTGASNNLTETGILFVTYNSESANPWTMSQMGSLNGTASTGVIFSITSVGQVQYSSSSLVDGTGIIYFRAKSFS